MAKTDKTDKKIKKADKKTGSKCGAILALITLAATLVSGCASTGAQPSRSQTLNNDFRDCIVVVAAHASVTNTTVVANSDDGLQPIELFTQTMKNEGSESNAPTATPTLDIKTDITAKYNDAIAAATTASKSVLGQIGDGLTSVLDLMSSKKSGSVPVTLKDGTAATVKCENGQCAIANGSCPGGVCSPGECAEGECKPAQ